MTNHWETVQTEWFETKVVNCELCGKMIPRRIWKAEVNGSVRSFCSEDCERMYVEYWLPKYGQPEEKAADHG